MPRLAKGRDESHRYKTDNDEDTGGNGLGGSSDASVLGVQFAEYIQSKNLGLKSAMEAQPKSFPAFKPSIFSDTKYNPALANTHICYEYDAQFGEMEKHWSRAGKKFSDEPRIGKLPLSDQGPRKPEELPNFCEKERTIFGVHREIRPFSRAQKYTRPVDRCNLPYKPTKDEETAHLGPGAYAIPDPWKARPGHGNVTGTSPFINRAKSRGKLSESMDDDRPASPTSLFHLQITGSPSKDFLAAMDEMATLHGPRSSLLEENGAGGMGGGEVGRNSPPSAPKVTTNKQNVSGVYLPLRTLTTSSSEAVLVQAIAKGKSVTELQQQYLLQQHKQELLQQQQQQQQQKQQQHTHQLSSSPISKQRASSSPGGFQVRSRLPGMSFGKGTFAQSSLDLITGTTGADIKYRRIIQLDGTSCIMATSNSDSALPQGAHLTNSFATTHAFAETDEALGVIADPVSIHTPIFKDKSGVSGFGGSASKSSVLLPSSPGSLYKLDKSVVLTGADGGGLNGGGSLSSSSMRELKQQDQQPVIFSKVEERKVEDHIVVSIPSPFIQPLVDTTHEQWRPPSSIKRTPTPMAVKTPKPSSPYPAKFAKDMKDDFTLNTAGGMSVHSGASAISLTKKMTHMDALGTKATSSSPTNSRETSRVLLMQESMQDLLSLDM